MSSSRLLRALGCPTLVRDMQLNAPALLEASAGTGKTYSIEFLVLRLLLEGPKPPPLERLLVVTFTEKAAGELAHRIRERLERSLELLETKGAVSKDVDELVRATAAIRLRKALGTFDFSSIHTIHGFCRKVLSEYAFENDVLFQGSLVDEWELMSRALQLEMRDTWRGELAPLIRRHSRLLMLDKSDAHWQGRLLKSALAWQPDLGDQWSGLPMETAHAEREARRILEQLSQMLGPLPPEPERSVFYLGYARLNVSKVTLRPCLEKVVSPLLALIKEYSWTEDEATWREEPVALGWWLSRLAHCLSACNGYKGFRESGPICLRPSKFTAKGPNLEVCPELESFVDLADRLCELGAIATRDLFQCVVTGIAKRAQSLKEQNGLFTFGDMIAQLQLALEDSGGNLRDELRRRFSVAVVDEFQDTDARQWRIFEGLFLGQDSGHNQLFLIGDPKQAIYKFRGADIFTYFQAREKVSQGGSLLRLDANYRSCPPLVECFNALFAAEGGWFAAPVADSGLPQGALHHFPVNCGSETRSLGPGNDAPIHLIEITGNGTRARRQTQMWIAEEVLRLVAGAAPATLPTTEGERPLAWGDICILVRSRSERMQLEWQLRRARVPFSVYKKAGIYQSDESLFLFMLLDALSDPSDGGKMRRALLTPPVDLHPGELGEGGTWDTQPWQALWAVWSRLAREQKWPAFFHSLLHESHLAAHCGRTDDPIASWEGYRHLCRKLCVQAVGEGLSLMQLRDRLRNLRDKKVEADEQGDLYERESDRSMVQIMTMHASKGLEFPVVFVAGGFTQSPRADVYTFRRREGESWRTLHSADPEDREACEAHALEEAWEDRRLFYVACTRAARRLYLPLLPEDGKSALSGFVSHAARYAHGHRPELFCLRDGSVSDGLSASAEDCVSNVTTYAPRVSITGIEAGAADGALRGSDQAWEQHESGHADPNFTGRASRVESYSRLVHGLPPVEGADDRGRLSREETPAPYLGEDAFEAHPDALPPGAETGDMLHELLENLPFEVVRNSDSWEALAQDAAFDAVTGRVLEQTGRPDLRKACARLSWNALHAALPLDGEAFQLCYLPQEDRLAEMEFWMPTSTFTPGEHSGFLMGYVDLVFRHNGRYYVLDWKSNILPDYGPESIRESMRLCGYDIQACLYSHALHRWLETRLPGYDPKKHFGGSVYAYLRGMRAGEGHGVLWTGSTPEELGRTYPARLAALMARRSHAS